MGYRGRGAHWAVQEGTGRTREDLCGGVGVAGGAEGELERIFYKGVLNGGKGCCRRGAGGCKGGVPLGEGVAEGVQGVL